MSEDVFIKVRAVASSTIPINRKLPDMPYEAVLAFLDAVGLRDAEQRIAKLVITPRDVTVTFILYNESGPMVLGGEIAMADLVWGIKQADKEKGEQE